MADTDTPVRTVHQALAAVINDMPAIGKDDRAAPQQGNYAYRGIEAITRHAQTLFGRHGIVITPAAKIISVQPAPGMKEGWQDWTITVDYTVAGPDGSTLVATTIGVGRDNTDKGVNKAMTQAYKYLLLQMLCVGDRRDEPDGARYEHGRVRQVVLSEDQQQLIIGAFNRIGDEQARRAAKVKFARQFGQPNQVLDSQWDDVEVWFSGEGLDLYPRVLPDAPADAEFTEAPLAAVPADENEAAA